ncbi:MAG: tetratricopeptide repeat protein [Vicinamibacteria bacterium]
MERKRFLLAAGVLLLAVVAAYSRSFHGPFVFDDLTSIPENPNIRQLWPLTKAMSPPPELGALGGRPLPSLSFAVNYALGGYDVRGYHVVNLLLHLASVLLLWRVVARTLASPALQGRFGGEATAFVIALLWAVHPLLSEAVVYIVQRTELMMGFFYLLTLYASLAAWTSPRANAWQAAAVGACALGMACKEPMVTAPIVVLLHDLAFRGRPVREVLQERRAFYAGLASTWLVLAAIVAAGAQIKGALGGGGKMTSFEYLRLQTRALTHYLRLAFWPHPLQTVYDWKVPGPVFWVPLGLVVVGLLLASVWAVRARRPWLAFLGAWFFFILAPTSSVLPLHTEPVAERRMYLPLVAVLALVVVAARGLLVRLLPDARARLRAGAAATALVAAAFVAVTFVRVRDYRTVLLVWEDALRKAPASNTVRNNLGNAYALAGRLDEAMDQYRTAIRLQPDHPLAYFNMGFTLVHRGRFVEAVEPLKTSVALRANDGDAQYVLARALFGAGRQPEAITHYEAALALLPQDAEIRRDYGIALQAVGRLPDAAQELRETLAARPADHTAHSKLGNTLMSMGRFEEALKSYREAVRLQPKDARTRGNLGTALIRLGRIQEGVAEFRQALVDDPAYALGHFNLANVQAKDGHSEEAAREYLAAIRHSGKDQRLRAMAADRLGSLRGASGVAAVLAAAASDPDPAVRAAAGGR